MPQKEEIKVLKLKTLKETQRMAQKEENIYLIFK